MTPAQRVDLLRAACCVAGADGETTDNERALIKRLADAEGVGAASLNAMMDRAQCDPDFCKEQFRVLKADPRESMAVLIEVAMADGDFDAKEKLALRTMANNLNIPEETFEELVGRVNEMLQDRGH
jgi:tellurite resistance protein